MIEEAHDVAVRVDMCEPDYIAYISGRRYRYETDHFWTCGVSRSQEYVVISDKCRDTRNTRELLTMYRLLSLDSR